MSWKEAKISSVNIEVEGCGGPWVGAMRVYAETDDAGNLRFGDDGAPIIVPFRDPARDFDKPGLMKEFATLLADKTRDLNQENEELRAQLATKDKEVEELRQKKDDLQLVVTDSFKVLVDKVAKTDSKKGA